MRHVISAITLSAVLVVLTLSSCERKDDTNIAGKGGMAVLKVTPQHHGTNIDSCTIFLKYNSKELPSSFDEEIKCVMENGKPVATFNELKKGDYYVYGKGWDPDISQQVVGGIPYTISDEQTYTINIPVTEGD